MQNKPLFGSRINKLHPISDCLECRILFNEKIGTRVTDLAGKFNPVLVGNYSWVGTKGGGGVHLLGTDDYINMGKVIQNFVDYNKPWSINYWVALPVLTSAWKDIAGIHYNNGAWEYFMPPRYYSNKFQLALYTYSSPGPQKGFEYGTVNNVPLVANKQHHIAITYDGTQTAAGGKMYFDGAELALTFGTVGGGLTESIWQPGRLASRDWIIGGSNQGTIGTDLEMKLDQVMLHSRVLNKSEIINLYNDPWLGVGDTRRFGQLINLDWTPHDPMGMLGIHGI